MTDVETMARGPVREELSDEEIVRRVQRGERELFDVIYQRHFSRLYGFARRMGVRGDDLEDLLTDTFTRALNGITGFRTAGGARYLPYLYAIVRNQVRDRARQSKTRPESLPLEGNDLTLLSRDALPLDQILLMEQVEEIQGGLDRLSDSDRMIILLSYERGLSSREIMAVMDKPSVTAVTTHLYKAMKKLRQQVLRGNPAAASPADENGWKS